MTQPYGIDRDDLACEIEWQVGNGTLVAAWLRGPEGVNRLYQDKTIRQGILQAYWSDIRRAQAGGADGRP